MGLDPATACVGFKWDNERANVATRAFSTKADWDNCLEIGIGLTRRARSQTWFVRSEIWCANIQLCTYLLLNT
jgi:hypothetical protein